MHPFVGIMAAVSAIGAQGGNFTYLKCPGFSKSANADDVAQVTLFVRFNKSSAFYFLDYNTSSKDSWGENVCRESTGQSYEVCKIEDSHLLVEKDYKISFADAKCEEKFRPSSCPYYDETDITLNINRVNGKVSLTTVREHEAATTTASVTTFYGTCQRAVDPLASRKF